MLVSIEGIDGSGKSTLWESLQEEFSDAVYTREPTTDTFYSDAVYQSLQTDDADSLAELFLYLADHAAHLSNTVEPALENGETVISDRGIDSRAAYQSVTLEYQFENPMRMIDRMHSWFTIVPDVTLFLDVDPEVAVERSAKANKFEDRKHLEEVREKYLERINRDEYGRFHVIDAEQSPDDVLWEAVSILRSYGVEQDVRTRVGDRYSH